MRVLSAVCKLLEYFACYKFLFKDISMYSVLAVTRESIQTFTIEINLYIMCKKFMKFQSETFCNFINIAYFINYESRLLRLYYKEKINKDKV